LQRSSSISPEHKAAMLPSVVNFVDCGICSFAEMRERQVRLHGLRRAGDCPDTILFCEHPPTLSLGRRTRDDHLLVPLDRWRAQGVEVVCADRGGGPTYHAPGQLVVYPIVSLREWKLGVRSFVMFGLEVIAEVLTGLGLAAVVRSDPVGVWVLANDSAGNESSLGRKIASVGLRVRQGVTEHGFSINVSCDLQAFTMFLPCGLQSVEVTSVQKELCAAGGNLDQISASIRNRIDFRLNEGRCRV
jgi:lipoate-protein ligase B